jgi:hypothetical protein
LFCLFFRTSNLVLCVFLFLFSATITLIWNVELFYNLCWCLNCWVHIWLTAFMALNNIYMLVFFVFRYSAVLMISALNVASTCNKPVSPSFFFTFYCIYIFFCCCCPSLSLSSLLLLLLLSSSLLLLLPYLRIWIQNTAFCQKNRTQSGKAPTKILVFYQLRSPCHKICRDLTHATGQWLCQLVLLAYIRHIVQ